MDDGKRKLKSIKINFNQLQDMDSLVSINLNAGVHITIVGVKEGCSSEVTYKLCRQNALNSGILEEEYE